MAAHTWPVLLRDDGRPARGLDQGDPIAVDRFAFATAEGEVVLYILHTAYICSVIIFVLV